LIVASAFDAVLIGLVVGVAAWTVVARQAFAAVTGFVAYGLLLALVWVGLHAVDVALAEAAIGGGLTGVLLLGAAMRLRPGEEPAAAERPALPTRALAAALAACVAAGLAWGVLSLPDPAPTLAPRALEHIDATGLGNPVTAVLMAYRATDTLLEKVVLVLALVGIWSLAPDRLWGGRPGPRQRADPDGPLAFLARLLPPAGIVLGVFILWNSADNPGGAFQGATLIAAMGQLVLLAGLSDAPPLSRGWLRWVLAVGPVAFLAVGLGGLWLGEAFLAYPVSWAKPLILAIELGMIVSVAVTLGLLMAGAPQRRTGP
jgi:multisubunit Na+/H+ antiporter MnhB subunit